MECYPLVPDVDMENEIDLRDYRFDSEYSELIADNYSGFAIDLFNNSESDEEGEFDILNLIEDNNDESLLEFNLDSMDKYDGFLYDLVKLVIKTRKIPETFCDKLLKLLQPFIPNSPSNFNTLINRYLKNKDNYDYCIRCTNLKCNHLLRFNKKSTSNIKCSKCNQVIDFKEHTSKKLPQTVIFSIKDQLQKFSKLTSDLIDMPQNLEDEFTVELIGSSDGLLLSKSSKLDLYEIRN